jgi:hypothetical protein
MSLLSEQSLSVLKVTSAFVFARWLDEFYLHASGSIKLDDGTHITSA